MIDTPGFALPVDIGNRALHHVGADHELTAITDVSKPARLIRSVYHKLRKAELRRNAWTFAIRHSILRPLDVTSMEWTPPTYSAATTYAVGQVVQYDDGLGSRLFIAQQSGLLAVTPGTTAAWTGYFGPLIAPLHDADEAYYAGDIVYTTTNNVTFAVYLSLSQSNPDEPGTTAAWDALVTYMQGAIVSVGATNYISLVDGNLNYAPATSPTQWAVSVLTGSYQWVLVGTVVKPVRIMYPFLAGPASQSSTLNAYPVPYGYLRKLKPDPAAGGASSHGAPTNSPVSDWVVENGYIVTRDSGAIVLRFVADVADVSKMDAMFCEGLAAKIGFEIAEPLTQSTDKVKLTSGVYQKAITEARLINSIENGADAPELDDWLACRS